jgi:hypothetical protein
VPILAQSEGPNRSSFGLVDPEADEFVERILETDDRLLRRGRA